MKNPMGRHYHTKESVEDYIQKARDHNGKQIIVMLKKFLPASSVLLEIGSGPGTDWNILNAIYNVVGSDNSREFLKHLNATFPDGKFLELDASTLDTTLKPDGIYSNKVLHHLEDDALETSIQRQFEVLNPGGIVCHSFWKGEDSETYNDLFVNYHSDSGIRTLFEEHFEPLLLRFYRDFEEGDSIVYIGKKREGQPS